MPGTNIRQMAVIGLMTAICCILAPISLVLPFSPVPISLGTLAIYFILMVSDRKCGFISVMLYIFLGLAGLPVFSGFTGGAGKLFGPTGGYIIGYLFLAAIGGWFLNKWRHKKTIRFIGIFLGTSICYLFGTLWLSYQSGISFFTAFASTVLPFIPGDIIKFFIAMTIGSQVRKRLKRAGLI